MLTRPFMSPCLGLFFSPCYEVPVRHSPSICPGPSEWQNSPLVRLLLPLAVCHQWIYFKCNLSLSRLARKMLRSSEASLGCWLFKYFLYHWPAHLTVSWLRTFRQFSAHFTICSSMPYTETFSMRILQGTVSKAFLKSRKIRQSSPCFCFSIFSPHSSQRRRRVLNEEIYLKSHLTKKLWVISICNTKF